METKDKIARILAKNPELKETLLLLQDPKVLDLFHTINKQLIDQHTHKILLIGRNSEPLARLYQLAHITIRGYIHTTLVSTPQLLDMLTQREDEETPSITSVQDDLVLIKDSIAFMHHKQSQTLITQVLDQNPYCIYYYQGTHKSFINTYNSDGTLIEYCKLNGIKKINTDNTVLKIKNDTRTDGSKIDNSSTSNIEI